MTTFLERLKADPLNRASQGPLCPPSRAMGTVPPDPPPGYRRPGKWDQLWPYRRTPGRILLATHRGWEGIEGLILLDTTKRVDDLDERGNPIWDPVRRKYRMYVTEDSIVIHIEKGRPLELAERLARLIQEAQ